MGDITAVWKFPRLYKPFLVPGNSLIATSHLFVPKTSSQTIIIIINNNNKNNINDNHIKKNNVQWKLDIQKRVWQMDQKIILQELWAYRAGIIHEGAELMTKEQLWGEIHSKIH